ncbi:jg5967 [Pararge aegeria aegeria]|uniref:Jg5967 protein n=1 Tax=Pararge aegeria aegeria TaxID=348720 RepID=A0A8S4RI99_9NEOP|nr:jg5967 [Pararge aegeria aegeria]
MGKAHSSESGWTLGSQGAGMAAPLVSKALIEPQRGGQTTSSASQGAASGTNLWNLELPTKDLRSAMNVYRLI